MNTFRLSSQIDAGSLLGRFGKTANVISEEIIMRNYQMHMIIKEILLRMHMN